MCGLVGYVYLDNHRIDSCVSINNMLDIQKHRGPDDSGIHFFDLGSKGSRAADSNFQIQSDDFFTGVIGFNRLSIQDLSFNGHQPMTNVDGNVILAFNGEIYNALDFKDELVKDGYRFKSKTDTEIILNLYLKYGFERMVSLLNGMFAIVIIDLNSQSIYLARDRFGIKPLYFFKANNFISFSSEIKSFFSLPEFFSNLNIELLSEFLLFRNNINDTLFKNVINVEPGHFLVINQDGGVKDVEFFDVNNYNRNELINNFENESLIDVLSIAVKSQLISDVKLGCQLSGGIDSSLITYLANKFSESKFMETISILFENEKFNEERYVDEVSKNFLIKSNKLVLNSNYYVDKILESTYQFDLPINHPNTIGIYLLSENAKGLVSVLLSGEGADEIFGGYDRFLYNSKWYLYPKFIFELKKSGKKFQFLNNLMTEGYGTILSTSFIHIDLASQIYPNFKIEDAVKNRSIIYNRLSGSRFDKQQKYEIKTYLPDLLMRQDKMSMAHSIENRVPFLDNNVVKWAFSQPEKSFNGLNPLSKKIETKIQLKKLCESIYGTNFAFRDKMSFSIPLRQFVQTKSFRIILNDIVLPRIHSEGIFDYKRFHKLSQNLDIIDYRSLDLLWVITTFQIWKNQFKVN